MQLFEIGEASGRQEIVFPETERLSRMEDLVGRLDLTLSRRITSARARHESRGILAATQLYLPDVLRVNLLFRRRRPAPVVRVLFDRV